MLVSVSQLCETNLSKQHFSTCSLQRHIVRVHVITLNCWQMAVKVCAYRAQSTRVNAFIILLPCIFGKCCNMIHEILKMLYHLLTV